MRASPLFRLHAAILCAYRNKGWQFTKRWQYIITPYWLAPTFGGMAIIVGLITTFLAKQGRDTISLSLGLGCVSMIVAAWLAETNGLRWPHWIFVGIVVVGVTVLLALGNWSVAPVFLLMVVTWRAYVGQRQEGLLVLAFALLGLLPLPVLRHDAPADWTPWVMGMGYSWVCAHALATQQRLLSALRVAQADLARQSAAEERRRIAREVHDVIAHSLAVTMLHLTGARHVLSRDPHKAEAALAQAEYLGRQSLADIRRTVGLLGSNPTSGTVAALPSANDISSLVDDFARAGLDVCYKLTGDPGRLTAAVGLALYRITEEALANVGKHAPGAHTEVELLIGAEQATLRVADTGSPAGAHPLAAVASSGLGLAGMRERSTLLDGNFSACQTDAGWRIECIIPI